MKPFNTHESAQNVHPSIHLRSASSVERRTSVGTAAIMYRTLHGSGRVYQLEVETTTECSTGIITAAGMLKAGPAQHQCGVMMMLYEHLTKLIRGTAQTISQPAKYSRHGMQMHGEQHLL